MNEHNVEVKNLSHSYRTYKKGQGFLGSLKDLLSRNVVNKQALQEVSFCIASGEIVGLLGPNGAGKTTLLKILSGLVLPTSGVVRVLDMNPHKKERKFLKQIGMVMGQKSQLLWDIPALDTLTLIREVYEISDTDFDRRLSYFMDLLSIGSLLSTPVRNLSLGERMKFELVASLIHNPTLLFLDEPTIGLDVVSQRIIRDFLQRINREIGTTIIITSHYLRDIEVLANRVLIIKKGVIVNDSPIDNLLKKFEHLQKVYFVPAHENFQITRSYEKNTKRECVITCHPTDLQIVIAELANQVPLVSLRTEEASLEDAIFSIFEDNGES